MIRNFTWPENNPDTTPDESSVIDMLWNIERLCAVHDLKIVHGFDDLDYFLAAGAVTDDGTPFMLLSRYRHDQLRLQAEVRLGTADAMDTEKVKAIAETLRKEFGLAPDEVVARGHWRAIRQEAEDAVRGPGMPG